MTYTHERTLTERHTQSTYSNTNTMCRGTRLQLLLVAVVGAGVGIVQQFYEATWFMHNKSVTVPKTLSHMTFTPVINCGKCFVTRESSVSHETIFRHCFLSSHFLPTRRWPFKTWRNGHTYTTFVSRAFGRMREGSAGPAVHTDWRPVCTALQTRTAQSVIRIGKRSAHIVSGCPSLVTVGCGRV